MGTRTASHMAEALVDNLKYFNPLSITVDNGLEFARHKKISQELSAPVYFSHTYSSFERGTNENTNGLLRRYLPKRTSLSEVTQEDLNDIAYEFNTRPRKVLGYKTPLEVYQENIAL